MNKSFLCLTLTVTFKFNEESNRCFTMRVNLMIRKKFKITLFSKTIFHWLFFYYSWLQMCVNFSFFKCKFIIFIFLINGNTTFFVRMYLKTYHWMFQFTLKLIKKHRLIFSGILWLFCCLSTLQCVIRNTDF